MNVRIRKHSRAATWRLVSKKCHQFFHLRNLNRPHGQKERIMRAMKTCLTVIAMALFLTACGGGGSSDPTPTPPAGGASQPPVQPPTNPASATIVATAKNSCVIGSGKDRCPVGIQTTWTNTTTVTIKDTTNVSVATLGASPAIVNVDVTLAGRTLTPFAGNTAIGASLALSAVCDPAANLTPDVNGFCRPTPVAIVWPAPVSYSVGDIITLVPPGKTGANQLPVGCTGSSVLQACYQQAIADGTAKVAKNHLVDPRDGSLMSVVLFYNRTELKDSSGVVVASGVVNFMLVHESDGSLVNGQSVRNGIRDIVTKAVVTTDGILYRNDTVNECGEYKMSIGWTVASVTCPAELTP